MRRQSSESGKRERGRGAERASERERERERGGEREGGGVSRSKCEGGKIVCFSLNSR